MRGNRQSWAARLVLTQDSRLTSREAAGVWLMSWVTRRGFKVYDDGPRSRSRYPPPGERAACGQGARKSPEAAQLPPAGTGRATMAPSGRRAARPQPIIGRSEEAA